MPLGRRGRPGVVGTMARTAVIAGTASATANAVNRRQAGKAQAAADEQAAQQAAFESQAQIAEMQAQMNAMQASAAAPPAGDDMMTKLQQLNEMKQAGLLSDEEFAAAKAKLLA